MERVPYNKDELKAIGMLPPAKRHSKPRKKYSTPVTPRENYKAALNRQLPLWIPFENDSMLMMPGINPDNHARAAVNEVARLNPDDITDFHDMFGVEWVYVPQAGGSMVKPGKPLLEDVNDWEEVVTFPDIDKWDWDSSAKLNEVYAKSSDRLVTVTVYNGFFERLISFMDFQNAVMALIDEDQKDAVHALFSELCVLYDMLLARYKECYAPDVICLHDDWGSQRAPFFSLATAREMLVPYIGRFSDRVHKYGMKLELHSCGKNEMLVPAYIEAGVDLWTGQPINDKDFIYSQYGDKIILGVEPDIQPDPNMSDADAIAAAKRLVEKYAPNYGNKPVIASIFQAPDAYVETIYEESRIYLS